MAGQTFGPEIWAEKLGRNVETTGHVKNFLAQAYTDQSLISNIY